MSTNQFGTVDCQTQSNRETLNNGVWQWGLALVWHWFGTGANKTIKKKKKETGDLQKPSGAYRARSGSRTIKFNHAGATLAHDNSSAMQLFTGLHSHTELHPSCT